MKTKTPTLKKVPLADVIANASAQVTELPFFEGFYAGKHTDRHGQVHEFSKDDLQQMVNNFVPNTIPFLTTHPEANEPSYGFAKEIKLTDDDKLYLNGDNVDVGFATSVIKGNFGKRSLGLEYSKDKGWYIDHVAFLGAVKPALNLEPVGMREFNAAATAVTHFDFSVETQTANLLTKFLRNFKTYMRTNGMTEENADSMVNEWEIDWLQRASIRQEIEEENPHDPLMQFSSAPGSSSNPGNTTNHPLEEDDVRKFTQEQLDAEADKRVKAALDAQKAQFSQGQQTDKDRIAALEKDKATMEFNQCVKDNNAWVKAQIAAGKLLPAQAEGVAEFMAHIEGGAGADQQSVKFEFSKGEGEKAETVKQSPVEFMKAMVENGAKHSLTDNIDLDNLSTDSVDHDDIHTNALQYQKQNSCTYAVALDAVTGG